VKDAVENAGSTLVAVDTGTTNTRVWLLDGDRVLVRREAAVGARDTARDGSNVRLRAALRASIAEVLRTVPPGRPAPRRIAAAGMITSPQGLVEVPHLVAPAGVGELAAGARETLVEDVSDRPFFLVPGVRTAARPGAAAGIGATDVMRGEETLSVGLVQQGHLAPGGALLNVGSHWKLIRMDEAGRVAWSVTSLSGELVQAARSQTILASAVAEGVPTRADPDLLIDGAAEARRSGLARALFCVRLLELSAAGTPQTRLSFLLGAFIGADLDRLRVSGSLLPGTPITISGDEKVGGAWASVLEREGHPVRSLSPAAVEAGLLAGLRAVLDARLPSHS